MGVTACPMRIESEVDSVRAAREPAPSFLDEPAIPG